MLIQGICFGSGQHSSPCLRLVTLDDIVHMLTQCLSCSGVRLYHTVTVLPGTGAVVFGGRCSPDKPIQGLCKVTFDPSGACEPPASDGEPTVKLLIEPLVSTGNPPSARWRHTTSVVSYKGQFECTVFFSPCLCSICYGCNKVFFLQVKISCLSTVEKIPQRQFLVTVIS